MFHQRGEIIRRIEPWLEIFKKVAVAQKGLFISLGFVIMGAGLQTVLVSLVGRQAGFSVQALGWIGSCYFVGYLVGSRFVVQLIMGVAHIRAFSGLAALSTVSALSYMLWVDPFFWGLLRFFSGFCLAGLYVVVESWVNRMAVQGQRGVAISRYRQVDLFAAIMAQVILFLAPFNAPALFSLLCIFLAFSIVPLSMLKISQPSVEPLEGSRMTLPAAFRLTPVSLLGCFVVGMINSMVWALGPLFAIGVPGGTENTAALFLILILLGGAFAEGPIGKLSDRRDRRIIILVCSGISAVVAMGIFLMAADSAMALYVGSFLFGMFWIPVYSICIALAHDQTDPKQFLAVSSTILLTFSIGASLGPVLGGVFMGKWGIQALFGFIASLLLVVFLYGTYRMFVRRRVATTAQSEFVAVPRESGELIFELDPRTENPDGNSKD